MRRSAVVSGTPDAAPRLRDGDFRAGQPGIVKVEQHFPTWVGEELSGEVLTAHLAHRLHVFEGGAFTVERSVGERFSRRCRRPFTGLPCEQGRLYGPDQSRTVDRLGEQVPSAEPDRLDGIVETSMAAHEDHFGPTTIRQPAEVFGELEACEGRHAQIRDYNLRAIPVGQNLQGLPAIVCG